MSGELYIVIPDWDSFEHPDVQRHTTPPPWIKSYTRELDEDSYQALTPHRRALLHDLRRLYASKRGRLRLDTRSISRRLGVRVTTADIEWLNHAGFIHLDACDAQALDVDVDLDVDVETTSHTPPPSPLLEEGEGPALRADPQRVQTGEGREPSPKPEASVNDVTSRAAGEQGQARAQRAGSGA